MKPASIFSIAVALAIAPLLHAADLYVSPSGSDANPGTSVEKPLQTLQKANGLVKPGDTVWIMAGTYRNATTDQGSGSSSLLDVTTSGTPEAWITWRNYENDKPELIAQGCWNAIHLRASYIVIDGLIVTGNNDNVHLQDAEANGEINVPATLARWKAEGSMEDLVDYSATPDQDKPKAGEAPKPKPKPMPKSRPVTYQPPSPLYNGNGINVDCRNGPAYHHFVIRNCVVRKFGTVGISMIATDYYTIENCEIYNNAWYSRYGGSGFSQLGGRAFDEQPGYHNFIRNNRVYNNKGLCKVYYIDLMSDGNGMILDSLGDYSGGVLVQNNLIYNNGGSGLHVFKSNKAQIDIVNNTVWRNQQTWRLFDLGAHAAKNVRFLNNIVVADRYRKVNGDADPGVIYDYNIYSGSPQIGARGKHDLVADPMLICPATNRTDGNFRPQSLSPAFGLGQAESFIPRTDIEGKPRPADVPGIGAYAK